MLTADLLNLIKSRRSIRDFSDAPVWESEIEQLIDAARYAPSNSNRQPWKFLIVKSTHKKNEIIEKIRQKIDSVRSSIKDKDMLGVFEAYKEYFLFIEHAPVLIFALYKEPHSILINFLSEMQKNTMGDVENMADSKVNGTEFRSTGELISTSMAIQNILLTAQSLGLGTCCTTGPLIASEELKILLDIRPPFQIASIIAIGRYSEPPAEPSRKPVKDIIEVI